MTPHNEAAYDDSDESLDYDSLPKHEIHERLLWRWFDCFQQNGHFEAYCDAKRHNDTATCFALEKQHPQIAELHEDWGDIHALTGMTEGSPAWKEWLATKRHLFLLPNPLVVEQAERQADVKGMVRLAIPQGLTKKQLQQAFANFLDEHPEILGEGPKYKVGMVKGMTATALLKRIDRAALVYDLLTGTTTAEGDFKYSHAEIAELILKIDEVNRPNFDWSIKNEIDKKRFQNGTLPLTELHNYKRTIVDLGTFYRNCIEGTIRGTFPAS
ncbi:hypothetical protein [Burkholderia contaminans]|uniref:hypothetical protein n=1 Tax=Burkholderia contaminans TaxID=488447 RepID=UPI003D67B3AB